MSPINDSDHVNQVDQLDAVDTGGADHAGG